MVVLLTLHVSTEQTHLKTSGQCLMCTFRECLYWFLCLGQEKKGERESKGGPLALAGTREYEQSDRNR